MKTLAWLVFGALAVGSLFGFWAGPVLAAAGFTAMSLYIGLIVILHGCYLVTTCLN